MSLVAQVRKSDKFCQFYRTISIDRIEIAGQSVWLKGRSDEIWNYISSENKDEKSAS